MNLYEVKAKLTNRNQAVKNAVNWILLFMLLKLF